MNTAVLPGTTNFSVSHLVPGCVFDIVSSVGATGPAMCPYLRAQHKSPEVDLLGGRVFAFIYMTSCWDSCWVLARGQLHRS